MESNLFLNSELTKLKALDISCKRLDDPPENSEVHILINLSAAIESIQEQQYEIKYSTDIKCEESGEPKLFTLNYIARAIYRLEESMDEKKIKDEYDKELKFFVRELYNSTRRDINSLLSTINVRFYLPTVLPKEILEKSLNVENSNN